MLFASLPAPVAPFLYSIVRNFIVRKMEYQCEHIRLPFISRADARQSRFCEVVTVVVRVEACPRGPLRPALALAQWARGGLAPVGRCGRRLLQRSRAERIVRSA